MNRNRLLLILALIAMILVACGQSEDEFAGVRALQYYSEPELAEDMALDGEARIAPRSDTAFNSDVAQTSLQQLQTQERLIIRTGTMEIVVVDSEATAAEIGRLAESLEGWVVRADLRSTNGAKAGSITVRIPAEEYDTAVAEIKLLAIEVLGESVSSQDVTEEFVDLTARLANLEATADRVRIFLDEAKTVEEALAVNQELSRLESEIESLKGRIQYLSQSAAFSTLTVQLTPDELSQPIEVAGWRPEGAAKTAVEALISTMQTLADALIFVGIFCLPLFLLIGVPLFLIGRYLYRRRRRGEEEQEEVEETVDGDED